MIVFFFKTLKERLFLTVLTSLWLQNHISGTWTSEINLNRWLSKEACKFINNIENTNCTYVYTCLYNHVYTQCYIMSMYMTWFHILSTLSSLSFLVKCKMHHSQVDKDFSMFNCCCFFFYFLWSAQTRIDRRHLYLIRLTVVPVLVFEMSETGRLVLVFYCNSWSTSQSHCYIS